MSLNFIDGNPTSGGSDLSTKYITKEYVMNWYSELLPQVKTPGLYMWGYNSNGQLGDNSIIDKSNPTQTISSGFNWYQVACGRYHTAAIKTDGTLWTWGLNFSGQLATNTVLDKSSPVQTISTGSTWQQVACGVTHTSAIKQDGTLWLWGDNSSGELGNTTTTNKSSPIQTISAGTNWKQVSCGYALTAAIKTDGTLWLWGYDGNGQLGNNSNLAELFYSASPVQTISQGTNWKQVSCGNYHVAAIKQDGTLWLWGQNSLGELGDNSISDKSSPVQTIAQGNNWKQVSCGLSFTAAIKQDGSLWTWGYNTYGQLGNNSISYKSSPVQTISQGTNWKYVVCNEIGNILALKTDGTLWTWGNNQYGSLGNNSINSVSSPIQVMGNINSWMSIGKGGYSNTAICDINGFISTNTNFRTSDSGRLVDIDNFLVNKDNFNYGDIWAWGDDSNGQLANNLASSALTYSSPIQTVAGNNEWLQVSANSLNSSFINKDGSLWLCGDNSVGQLGTNTIINKSSPVQTIAQGTNWKQVACGDSHTAAIKQDGTLWLWGDNNFGELGTNTVVHKSSPVQTVSIGTTWKQVACGVSYTAAIKTDGTLWLWGQNSLGELGDNSISDKSSPVQTISQGTNWKQVSCGVSHTAAIKTDGTLWTWGTNIFGQLGNNSGGITADTSSPVQTIAQGTNWKYVFCGQNFTAAIKTDGTLWTWGSNTLGQLGNNTIVNYSSPVQTIAQGTNWKYITCNRFHTIAIKTDGTLWSWGANNYGQLGDNTIINKSSPIQIATNFKWKQIASGNYFSFGIVGQ